MLTNKVPGEISDYDLFKTPYFQIWKPECNHKRLTRVHHMWIVIHYVENTPQKSKNDMQDIELDSFDLLDGKMSDVAMERLHKQICSKIR